MGVNCSVTKQFQLSDPAVKSRKKAPGRYLDGHGLYLQVADGGSRSWIFRYTLNKKTREMGVGSVDDFTLAEARERVKRFRQFVADGVDPIDHRRAEREERSRQPTEKSQKQVAFKECAEQYHAAHVGNWKNAKHGAQWINTMSQYVFPKFGNLPIAAVGKPEILKAVEPLWNTKAETASRVLQRIRSAINYGAAKDYRKRLDSEFWIEVRMALGANDRARKVEHHASCPFPDVSAVLQKVWSCSATPMVKLAFEFITLTGARSGEVRGALWSEFDANFEQWTIHGDRMKSGASTGCLCRRELKKLSKRP